MQACIGMHNQNEPARKYSTKGCFRRILLIQQQDNLQGSRMVSNHANHYTQSQEIIGGHAAKYNAEMGYFRANL